nr:hypothetical protein Iba_chr12cCG7690 [Ipomoea batatas]
MDADLDPITIFILFATYKKRVFSIRPFTILATAGLSSHVSGAVIIGVLIFLAAFMISLMRGTPTRILMLATPAKWKVFNVIWVPGSPML